VLRILNSGFCKGSAAVWMPALSNTAVISTLLMQGPLMREQADDSNDFIWAQSCHSAFVWKPEDKAF
jgi:hypothetical protein